MWESVKCSLDLFAGVRLCNTSFLECTRRCSSSLQRFTETLLECKPDLVYVEVGICVCVCVCACKSSCDTLCYHFRPSILRSNSGRAERVGRNLLWNKMKERSPRVAKDDDLEQHLLARCHCKGRASAHLITHTDQSVRGTGAKKAINAAATCSVCTTSCTTLYWDTEHFNHHNFTHVCTRPACKASVYAFCTATQPSASELTVREIQILDNLIYKQSRRQPACSKSRLAPPLDSLMLLPNTLSHPGPPRTSSHLFSPAGRRWRGLSKKSLFFY